MSGDTQINYRLRTTFGFLLCRQTKHNINIFSAYRQQFRLTESR
jgi:hypothetical protein